MAKKKNNQPESGELNTDPVIENLETQEAENKTEFLETVITEDNQPESGELNTDPVIEPLKAEIIEPKNVPVQIIEDGRVQVQGAHFKVSVSAKTSEIISKFKK
ncbi:hypothetical protein [Empedobacter sp.]|uniref:hypothetical protein n=1 Tax=Empedobacter sp. TaxID=1927715 RepID=UPI00289971F0|nr:hypothetical protein [Empedobacter sp.]